MTHPIPINRYTDMLNVSVVEDSDLYNELGSRLSRMTSIQMSAYPECWSVEDRREMAENYLANTAAPYRAFVPSASNPASRVSTVPASIDFRKGEL